MLRVSNNLGSVLNQLDLTSEAIPILVETLERRRKLLGDMHSHTTSTVNNLAQSYSKANQLDKALQLYQANLEVRKKALGPKHIQTIKAMYNLGANLFSSGKTDEAIQLIEEAIEIADSTGIGNNTDAMAMRTGLSQIYGATKQTEKAYSLCNKILELQTASLGGSIP